MPEKLVVSNVRPLGNDPVDIHVIDNWRWLATAHDEQAARSALKEKQEPARFEFDTWRIASRAIASGKVDVISL